MVLVYDSFGSSGRLHQGEILFGIQEYQPVHSGERLSTDNMQLEGELFDRQVVVVTPECDLVSDSLARQQLNDNVDNPENRAKLEAKLLNHIHLCEIYKEGQIRQLVTPGHTFWERIQGNQDVRYHKVPKGKVDCEEIEGNPELYLDFKRMLSMPSTFLYKSLQSGGVERRGVIPSPWVDSLIDRLFHFQGRVCVPDPNDARMVEIEAVSN